VVTLVLLVALAALTAAAFWWSMSRSRGSGGSEGERPASGAPEVDGEFFVLHPSDVPPPREDRPAPAVSVARIALAVAVTTAMLVAVAWLLGLMVKVQLDGYFRSGS
jgi:hypothetical protein